MKSQPDVPAVPSPSDTATAAGKANVNSASAEAALNNVNTVNPYSSTTYDTTGTYTMPDGTVVPRYTATTALNPTLQGILTGTENATANLVPGAEKLSTTIGDAVNTPLNFNTPGSSILNSTPEQINDKAADAIYNKQKTFMDPQWDQKGQELQDQLARQGIPVGSDAYNNAMKQYDNSRTQAYQAAQDSATAGGSTAAGNLFNMALGSHDTSLADQKLGETNGIDLLAKLFGISSVPSTPTPATSKVSVAPTDVVGATNSANNASMNSYNALLNSNNSTFGGLASLGGSAIRAFGPSLFA